jgi:hypothetical protein
MGEDLRTILAAVLLLGIGGTAYGADTPKSAFEVFKTVCIDTEMKPKAISASIAAFGGSKDQNLDIPDYLGTGKTDRWSFTSGLGKMRVLLQTNAESEMCTLRADRIDPSTLTEARDWAGHEVGLIFVFRESNGRREPVRDPATYKAATDDGTLWTIGVDELASRRSTTISLMHYRAQHSGLAHTLP